MKFTLGVVVTLLLSTVGFAVPRGMILVQPTEISKGEKTFTVHAVLPCKSISAPEWGIQPVFGMDDEGDQAISVGLVVSTSGSYCEKGSGKKYSFEYPYSLTNITDKEARDIDFVPMDVVQ